MKVAAFMSGSGTNLIKIIEYQKELEINKDVCPYEVVLVFTDNKNSNGRAISEKYGIEFIENDILDYYKSHGKQNKKDLSLRPGFDSTTMDILSGYEFDAIALAGYMSILTKDLLKKYAGKFYNVHPGDLSVADGDKRRYTGDKAVTKAILNGDEFIYATTHMVGEKVDYGQILLLSKPVEVILPQGIKIRDLEKNRNIDLLKTISDENQERLKERGDWKIFPLTLKMIADGRFGISDDGVLFLDGQPVPKGLRL